MDLYLAGGLPAWREQLDGHHLLVSFAERGQLSMLDRGWNVPGWVCDSGAFSVWRAGATVDLDAYCAWLDEHAEQLDGAIALDVIPGEPHRLPTEDEAKAAVEQSLANLAVMVARFGKQLVWPVFHEGDPDWLLDHLIAGNYRRIGLGATKSRGKKEIVDWLMPILSQHTEHQEFHGLAMTQRRLIEHMPFASVDSTTWLNLARYGVQGGAYLLRGRSREFWRRWNVTPEFWRPGIEQHFAPLSNRERMVVGITALHDMARCPRTAPPTRDGQLSLFPAS